MRWEQGRPAIERMLAAGELQGVPASRERADRLVNQARAHLASARAVCTEDPHGAYALSYDAARKALTAILENQGLRPTSRGGHLAVYEAACAQLDPPMGKVLRPFDRMRRRRHDAEYPPTDAPEITPVDIRDDLGDARGGGQGGLAPGRRVEAAPLAADLRERRLRLLEAGHHRAVAAGDKGEEADDPDRVRPRRVGHGEQPDARDQRCCGETGSAGARDRRAGRARGA
jgi:hypothetical protein